MTPDQIVGIIGLVAVVPAWLYGAARMRAYDAETRRADRWEA